MRSRIRWVDIAKAIGIFCIVLGHITGEGALKRYVYSFHIPLFFFLSGATFRVNGKPFARFARDKALGLLVPYAAFALVSQLVYIAMQLAASSVMQAGRSFTIAEGWLGIIWGNVEANRGLWFLPCLFLMSLMLYPIVKRLEENAPGARAPAIAAMVISAAYTAADSLWLHIGNLPWKLDAALKLLTFALAGWFFTHGAVRIRPAAARILGAALLALGGAAGIFLNERIMYLGSIYRNIPVFYLSSASSVLGICLLLMHIPGCRMLEYVGRRTLAILVMHKFPILFFEWICPGVKGWLAAGLPGAEIAVAVVSIALCCIAEKIILKICPRALGRAPAGR